jgi:mannose-6-phosphate isomerase-like protein (cupin superfamily)
MGKPVDEIETPWEPDPIPAESFHSAEGWANINRAPYDQVSGVLYKRAAVIKRVRYEPAAPAPEMPIPFQGNGAAVVRWLFSEQPGTEERLLEGRSFAFLHDLTLEPGAATGMQAQEAQDTLLYILEGEGRLHHCPSPGSPVITRVLRPGDAVLIRAGEQHRVANRSEEALLRLIVIGLTVQRCPFQLSKESADGL